MKTGNNVRVYYSTVRRPLNDTTAAEVVKDGNYTMNGNFVDISNPDRVFNPVWVITLSGF